MGLFDFLTGKVSKDEFAKRYLKQLRVSGVRHTAVYSRQHFAIRIDGPTKSFHQLGNAYAEYCQAPRRERAAVLTHHIQGVLTNQAPQADPAQEQGQYLPVIRNRFFALISLEQPRAGLGEDAALLAELAGTALSRDLAVHVAIDAPQTMRYLTKAELGKRNMDFHAALEQALDNLRQRSPNKWRRLSDNAYVGAWNDDYDGSRLLLPDLIHRLGLHGRPVVLVPARGILLVTTERSAADQILVLQFALQALETYQRWISPEFLVLDGSICKPYTPTDAQAAAWQRRLRVIIWQSIYAEQKELLDQRLPKQGADIFVATYMAMENKIEGSAFSATTWTESVSTYLPEADVVAMVTPPASAQEKAKVLFVPWAKVNEVAGGLLKELPDVYPPRYHVTDFPTPPMLAQLAKHQVPGLG